MISYDLLQVLSVAGVGGAGVGFGVGSGWRLVGAGVGEPFSTFLQVLKAYLQAQLVPPKSSK